MKSKWSGLLFVITLILFSCKGENPVDRFSDEVNAIDQYLSGANIKYIKHESGIRLVIHQYGDGPPPHKGQTVTIPLTGKLFSNGDIFTNTTFNDKVENLNVAGLKIAIPYLPEGTVAALYIPSLYAYGTTGTTGVPGNSTLVYEVTLTGITRTAAEQSKFDMDTVATHNFVKSSDTNAISHRSGIWYTIDTVGIGNFPEVYDSVSYYVSEIKIGDPPASSMVLSKQTIFNLIDGLKIGLPLMREKGTTTFYIPSGLTYDGNTGIASTANMKYVIRLDTIIKKGTD